jgi:signal peptidase II
MLKKLCQTGLCWIWIAIIVLLVDRTTKLLAFHFLTMYVPQAILPFFNLTLAYNKGAAFSLLSSASGWQMWLFSGLAVLISVAIVVWLKQLACQQRWLSIALSFILGGALGNLWDRVSNGYVIDFVEVHTVNWYFPAFNIADAMICIGAFMLILDTLFLRKKQ